MVRSAALICAHAVLLVERGDGSTVAELSAYDGGHPDAV